MEEAINDGPKFVPFKPENFYRRESFVDPDAGEIVMLVPVTSSNVRDTERKCRFFSSIVGNMGGQMVPINFEIEADTMEAALAGWEACATKAGDDFKTKVLDQQMKRNLVVPSSARMMKPN